LKKICLVVSHLASGSENLIYSLNTHPQCQFYESNIKYTNKSSLRWLFSVDHKCRNSSAIYGDHLLRNTSICNKDIYSSCKFIIVIRSARSSLEKLISLGLDPEKSASYYCFRLRRLCEIAKKSKMIFFSWEDLAKKESYDKIKEYLDLSSDLNPFILDEKLPCLCPEKIVERCSDAYERYYYYLKEINDKSSRN